MQDAKEEIKARLAIEDVISQYIELKRAGKTLKGRSPWGVDKTPSFMVSPEKGIWHDFSAGKGGDVISFVMEVEGLTFMEAMEKLAAMAGVDLEKYKKRGNKDVAKRKARAKEALELATKYYQFCLSKSKRVAEYVFYKRNLNRGTVEKFRIGYAPADGKSLKKFLMSRGFAEKELEDAGLVNRFGGDMFRGRMMVPFIDTNGVIGFTARVLDKSEPKYLNTSDTILFNKSRFIFGLAQAKEAIRKDGFVVIVEGNMDVISSHQAGVTQAVATSGTAMTEQHLKILSRLTSDIRLAYDGDDAGVNATERAIKLAGDLGINLTVISDYHGAKDPDELIQQDPKLWQEAVKKAQPAVEWVLDKYEEKVDLGTAFGKKTYSDVALRLLENVKDKVERAHYEEMVARRLGVMREDLRGKEEDLVRKMEEKPKRRLKQAKTEAKTDKIGKLESRLMAIGVFGGVNIPEEIDIPEDETKLAELEMIFEEKYQGWGRGALETEVRGLYERLKAEMRRTEVAKLTAELEDENLDTEREKEILRKITELQKNKE